MGRYIVQDGDKQYNGKVYRPGDVIDCTEAEAGQMRLTVATPQEGDPPRQIKPAAPQEGNKGNRKS